MTADPLRLLGVADLVAHAAAATESPALIVTADRIPLAYQDLIRLADELAERLLRNGLRPGDRMAIRINSSVEFVVGVLAASRAGIVAVPLDPALPAVEQRARIDAVGARVVLVATAAAAGWPLPCWPITVTVSGGGALLDLDPAAELFPATAIPDGLQDDDALIMFTGGTTGAPKMVPWNQENIARAVHNIIATYQLSPADATVAVMPLYHGHGLIAALLATLASGATLLLPASGRFSARTFWADIQAARATWYTAVPTIHQILLRHAETDYPGSQQVPLRFMRSCSAALSPAVAQELQTRFAAPVLCAYGMTEATHQISSMGLSAGGVMLSGQVGRPSGVQIRIVADNGQICPPGGVGEVWVRGHTVVRGYLGNPTATEHTFLNGWLR
ncbi:MAG: AMP-binding protein, partial [Mycobacteriaceae bacterium]|nr:AMP-binding protein [Mycobacteriaceae bacterium]